ncbi:MAG: peptide-methionine (S)-S-oxide reductase MsrA, partial [Thermoplasmata archaeon]
MSAEAEIHASKSGVMELATLGGGCFWCTEATLQMLRGVESVTPGYAGGKVRNPSYEDVCTGRTGHAEVVQVRFDTSQLTYSDLLRVFFTVHDPTTKDRQGNDSGPQYRSIVLAHSPEQAEAARGVIRELTEAKLWPKPIVTEIAPFTEFYAAEEYHRDYFQRNPDRAY